MSGCDIAEPHPWSKEADDEGHVRCTQCGTIGPLLDPVEVFAPNGESLGTVPPVAGALTEKWLGRLFYLSVAMTSDLRSHEFAELKAVMETLRSQNREMREALLMIWGDGLKTHFRLKQWAQVKKALASVEP